METLFLNFPTFYHCAIKGNTALSQFNAVSVLLLGKVREECVNEVVDDPAVSVYVSGRKSIRKSILTPLLGASHDEIVGRLNRLGIQDVQRMVDALSILLNEVENLSDAAKNPLFELSKRPGAEYDFVAEMFMAAIKCPDRLVHRLSNEAILYLNLLGWQERSAAEQPTPQEAEPDSTADAGQADSASSNARERQNQTSHAFPREGKELFLTYYNLAMPEDEDVVTHYFTDRSEDSFIALDPDDFSMFFSNKDGFTYSLVEISGCPEDVAFEISRWKRECLCVGCLIEIEISKDLGLEEISGIASNVQMSISEDANTIFSVRLGFENLQRQCCARILFQVKDSSSHRKSADSGAKQPPETASPEEDPFADIMKIFDKGGLGHTKSETKQPPTAESPEKDPFAEIMKLFGEK